jgi:hypothetical protein
MENLKIFFSSLSALFAIVPGVAVLITNLGVPEPEMKNLFAGVVEALGCISLALVILNRSYFKKKKPGSLTVIIIWSSLTFFISLLLYIFLFNYCVIDHALYGRVYFPLFETEQLHSKIKEAGGRYGFVEKYLGDGSRMIIMQTAYNSRIFTTIILLFVYQLALTSLVLTFGIAGVRTTQFRKQ